MWRRSSGLLKCSQEMPLAEPTILLIVASDNRSARLSRTYSSIQRISREVEDNGLRTGFRSVLVEIC